MKGEKNCVWRHGGTFVGRNFAYIDDVVKVALDIVEKSSGSKVKRKGLEALLRVLIWGYFISECWRACEYFGEVVEEERKGKCTWIS